LDYNFPQGFYKTMIEIMPEPGAPIFSEDIAGSLKKITGKDWRTINVRI